MADAVKGFAESCHRLRKERGWSQEALAAAAGTTAWTVSNIERGVCGPSLFHADAIATALESTVDAMTGRGQAPVPADAPAAPAGALRGSDAMNAVRAAQSQLAAGQRNARGKRPAPAVGVGMVRRMPGGAR